MHIENLTEYYGAKEYRQRLLNVLADGCTFLSGGGLELFSVSLHARLAEISRAIDEYEWTTGMHRPARSAVPIQTISVKIHFAPVSEPSVIWNWSTAPNVPGYAGRDFLLGSSMIPSSVRQLSLFTHGTYQSAAATSSTVLLSDRASREVAEPVML